MCNVHATEEFTTCYKILSDGNKFSNTYHDMRSFVQNYFLLKGNRKIRAYSGLLASEERMEEFLLTWAKL
jgi:hypothetical protein